MEENIKNKRKRPSKRSFTAFQVSQTEAKNDSLKANACFLLPPRFSFYVGLFFGILVMSFLIVMVFSFEFMKYHEQKIMSENVVINR